MPGFSAHSVISPLPFIIFIRETSVPKPLLSIKSILPEINNQIGAIFAYLQAIAALKATATEASSRRTAGVRIVTEACRSVSNFHHRPLYVQ